MPNNTMFDVSWNDNNEFFDFYDSIFNDRNREPLLPYTYGSYQIYKADIET